MKVLITGAAGFIGQHLTNELRLHGYDVVGVDLHGNDDDIHTCNLLDPGAFRRGVEAIRPNLVIHLAAQVGRLFGEDDIVHTVQSNAQMSAIVASTCKDMDLRLLYASTSEVYGDQGDDLCYEHGAIKLSHNLYGVSKWWGEQVAALYAPFDGLQVIRLSMPYGPGMVPGRGRAAIINMLWQANTSQPIPVHMGSERAWCWVGDTVHGIRRVIEDGERAYDAEQWQRGIGVYNVGRSDNPVNMQIVAQMACEIADAPYELIEMTVPPGMQTVVKRLSNEKLRMLGWEPTVDLREGMERVFEQVRHFDANGHKVVSAESLGL